MYLILKGSNVSVILREFPGKGDNARSIHNGTLEINQIMNVEVVVVFPGLKLKGLNEDHIETFLTSLAPLESAVFKPPKHLYNQMFLYVPKVNSHNFTIIKISDIV